MVITGASSGIGEAAAHLFAEQGATVVVVARRQDLLTLSRGATGAIALACDLSDLDAVDDLVKTVEDRLGGVDILVNNAGKFDPAAVGRVAGPLARRRADDGAELLLAAAA